MLLSNFAPISRWLVHWHETCVLAGLVEGNGSVLDLVFMFVTANYTFDLLLQIGTFYMPALSIGYVKSY